MAQTETAPPANTASTTVTEPKWGRVVLCGGTDWPKLGRKEKGGVPVEKTAESPDLLEPHILRSLSNIKASSIHTSGISCHCVVLDTDGTAWLFGRNESSSLGTPAARKAGVISENAPIKVTAPQLGAAKGTTFVHAATGRNHSVLVGSNGDFWTAGANNHGQCGHSTCAEVQSFKLVNGPRHDGNKEKVVQASAGVTFSLVLTDTGKIYAFGSGEKGQLGNGRTGEHIVTAGKTAFDIETDGVLVRGLEGKQIVQIASGAQHSIALDSTGLVYVWGYNGYCRLGLGHQKDMMLPTIVPTFAGPNEVTMGAKIIAGPTNSVVVDKQGMYWMAGKWKNTGDGSTGQPYSQFRYMQDIMGCQLTHACSGGVTHWALTPDDDGSTLVICWGQGAGNGELGLGADQPKSATKPQRNETLIGLDVLDVAAGQNTSFLIIKPSEKLSDLPRHPVDLETPSSCVECGKEDENDALECEKCDNPYHLTCLSPPLSAVPDGEWFCPECEADPGAPLNLDGSKRPPKKGKGGGKKAVKKAVTPEPEPQEEDDECEEDARGGKKRKTTASSDSAAAKGRATKRKK